MHHAGLHERDRKTVEELFVNCKIQVCPQPVHLACTEYLTYLLITLVILDTSDINAVQCDR